MSCEPQSRACHSPLKAFDVSLSICPNLCTMSFVDCVKIPDDCANSPKRVKTICSLTVNHSRQIGVPSVEEWLQYKVEEEFSGNVTLKLNQDIAAKLNVYWLGTCVDNLLRNAVKYGVAPVTLEVITQTNLVTFKVTDQGSLTHRDWRHLRKPFVSKSGLGLGLTIVESMVGRMGGKMSLEGPPTTFILEIPCETDTASR